MFNTILLSTVFIRCFDNVFGAGYCGFQLFSDISDLDVLWKQRVNRA